MKEVVYANLNERQRFELLGRFVSIAIRESESGRLETIYGDGEDIVAPNISSLFKIERWTGANLRWYLDNCEEVRSMV